MRTRAYGVAVWIAVLTLCPRLPLAAGSDEKRVEPAKSDPATDLSKFPKLQGTVEQVLGNFGVFVPPKGGATFRLELPEVLKLKQLVFDEQKRRPDAVTALPYILLGDPLVVQSVKYDDDGSFQSMRLLSKKGDSSVMLDIVRTERPKQVLVWVIAQSDDHITAVTLIDCKFDGAFPNRPK